MKHLVECKHCDLQYDATGRHVGSHFRCHCGHRVTVSRPQSDFHLQVVRCCNCGAGREDDHPHCSFCGAGFSLSARDLDLICGHCTERTGSRSKFCHICGTAIKPLEVVSEAGDLACPRCEDSRLLLRQLGDGVAIHECEVCTGVWLPRAIFDKVENRSVAAGRLVTPSLHLDDCHAVKTSVDFRKYIRCPVCTTLMNRNNYRKVSGILIDMCPNDGIWFDPGELAQIVAWLEKGGEEIACKKSANLDADLMLARHRESLSQLNHYDDSAFRQTSGGGSLFELSIDVGGLLAKGFFKK